MVVVWHQSKILFRVVRIVLLFALLVACSAFAQNQNSDAEFDNDDGPADWPSNTTTTTIQLWLWMPRTSGTVSFLSSLAIMIDVAGKHRRKRGTTTTTRANNSGSRSSKNNNSNTGLKLLFMISLFDLFYSAAWALVDVPVPVDNKTPFSLYARGNQASCIAQGFFLQLGITGMMFQVSLSTYYVMVICHNKTEYHLGKVRKWFYLPLVPGLALAFAGIPFYTFDGFSCYIAVPPFSDSYKPIWFFLIVPIALVILYCTAAMVYICVTVWKETRGSSRWGFTAASSRSSPLELNNTEAAGGAAAADGGGSQSLSITRPASQSVTSSRTSFERPNSARRLRRNGQNISNNNGKPSMMRQVFWQSVFYLASFYLSWPIQIFAFVGGNLFPDTDTILPVWLLILIGTLAPLQGFFNLLVYMRPLVFLSRCVQRTSCSRSSGSKNSNPVGDSDKLAFVMTNGASLQAATGAVGEEKDQEAQNASSSAEDLDEGG